MITFEFEDEGIDGPVFSDVDKNQFFVHGGRLYQKVGPKVANQLADEHCDPSCVPEIEFSPGYPIDRILPRVTKIHY